MNILVI